MSRDDEVHRAACAGGGDPDDLAEAFQAQTLDDTQRPPRSVTHNTRQSDECPAYKNGSCDHPEKCGERHHPVIHYPSASGWEYHHIKRLRFQCLSLAMDFFLKPRERLICDWLASTHDMVRVIIGRHQCDHFLSDSPGLLAALTCAQDNISYNTLAKMVNAEVGEGHNDGFLQLLTSFNKRFNNMQKEEEKYLMCLAKAVCEEHCKNQREFCSSEVHRYTLLTWIHVSKMYERGNLSEFLLDDLMSDIIRSAGSETNSYLRLKVRQSTVRKIKVCGNNVAVISNIEVSSLNAKGVLQVVTSTENKAYTRNIEPEPEPERVLPQMASEALAIAEDSPFGNKDYKTVYQVSIHSVHSRATKSNTLYAFLTRCHISCDTLTDMPASPIPNPLNRSVIMYQKIELTDMFNNKTIEFIYCAFKAVLALFHKCCKD
ncbi:uncharacterized protein LOC144438699 [Glandiceps talaboti]